MSTTTSRAADEGKPVSDRRQIEIASIRDIAVRLLTPLASLKLTVWLFAAAVFLIFAGTVAQVDRDVWTVVHDYFRTPIAWIEFQVFFPRTWHVPGVFPFPGGWLLGGVLLINLLAAHAVRFKLRARGARLMWGLAALAVAVAVNWVVIAGLLQPDVAATEGAAFWRVLWRLTLGTLAGVALFGASAVLFDKRAGIVTIHAGIILMLVSELVTGLYAEEGQMRLAEGQTANYVEDIRSAELVFTDPSDPTLHDEVIVPESILREEGAISHAALPVDIEVTDWMANADGVEVRRWVTNADGTVEETVSPDVTPTDPPLIQQPGPMVRIQFAIVETDPVSGTGDDQVNFPAVALTLRDKQSGEPLGSYTLSQFHDFRDEPLHLDAGGRHWDVRLRFKRTYKPYSVHLRDFVHETYVGTNVPRDFSSYITLSDPEAGVVDREVRIWMNNPLRYAGETFYQASYDPNNPDVTILQIVKNPSWMIPYVACMIVAIGLIGHLGSHLLKFLDRRAAA